MLLHRWLLALAALFFLSPSSAQTKVAVYVVAHPDDWQLFMGDDAFADIQDTNNRVVFILTTSGDNTGTRPKPGFRFARARERGVLNSVRFSADTKSGVDSACQTRPVTVNGHRMLCYPYKHVRTYFLRLPDGCFAAGYGGQSLEYLHDGRIDRITAIDSSATYEGWNDLVQTVRAVIEKEAGGCANITLAYQDPDAAVNPRDHPDHRFSGLAAAQAGAALPIVRHTGYLGYCAAEKPVNISVEDVAVKAGLFALADFGITEGGDGSSAFNKQHLSFLTRTYSRKLPLVDSAGTPRFSAGVSLYPNPAAGTTAQAGFSLRAAEKVRLQLTDAGGTVRWAASDVPATPGENQYAVPLAGLAPGAYYLTVTTAAGTEQVKLIRL